MNQRRSRLMREIALLAARFAVINYDEEGLLWVQIPHFELPVGWNRTETELLIELPPAYPSVPPNGFYLNQHLHLSSGKLIQHYFDEPGQYNPLVHLGWAWYCIHAAQSTWFPTTSLARGDNLLKYIELIRAVLTRAAQD